MPEVLKDVDLNVVQSEGRERLLAYMTAVVDHEELEETFDSFGARAADDSSGEVGDDLGFGGEGERLRKKGLSAV